MALLLLTLLGGTEWAAAEDDLVTAQGVTLSGMASCRVGAVELTYEADDPPVVAASFTSAHGELLDRSRDDGHRPDDDWVEHVRTVADEPPAAGTLVAVHVTVGTARPDDETTDEFFVLYQCDDRATDAGGANTVLATCVGDYGTCPLDAQGALAGDGHLDGSTAPIAAMPLETQPAFTG